MDNPLDAPMPSFDPDVTEPVPPKKPRPPPTRKKPKTVKVAPKPSKRPARKRKARRPKPTAVASKPITTLISIARLPVLMDASESIATILESLSREERDIVLRSPRVMKRLS